MKRKKSRMDMLAQQILAMQEELEEVTGQHMMDYFNRDQMV